MAAAKNKIFKEKFNILVKKKLYFFWSETFLKGPWGALLIEQLSEMVSFDVLKGPALFIYTFKCPNWSGRLHV